MSKISWLKYKLNFIALCIDHNKLTFKIKKVTWIESRISNIPILRCNKFSTLKDVTKVDEVEDNNTAVMEANSCCSILKEILYWKKLFGLREWEIQSDDQKRWNMKKVSRNYKMASFSEQLP